MDFITINLIQLGFIGMTAAWIGASQHDAGLRRPEWRPAIPWTAGYVVWALAIGLLLPLAHPLTPDEEAEAFFSSMTPAQLFISGVLTGPTLEEIFFRGALLSSLRRRWGDPAAVIAPALAWAVLHIQYDAVWMLVLFGEGIILARLRLACGSILPGLAIHMGQNGLAFFSPV